MQTIELPFKIKKPILACGADVKGAFAIAKGDKAYLVEGFGDLSDPANMQRYEDSIKGHEKKLGIKPEVIARDHHPGYFSSQFAEMHARRFGSPLLYDVQHHEAHIASAIVDNGIKTGVIGAAFDGSGLGWDGCIWGGEFFIGRPGEFKRAAHLEYIPMPGGEMAIREPWRMAASYLYRAPGKDFLSLNIDSIRMIPAKQRAIIMKLIDRGINTPLTSSAGRLFDAVASLVLSKREASFEAELPIELEKIAAKGCGDSYKFSSNIDGDMIILETRRLIKKIADDIGKKVEKAIISAKFHNTVAEIIVSTASALRRKSSLNTVVLSGGVFQNRYLRKRAADLLGEHDFSVCVHSNIKTDDSGIPIGQIAIANSRVRCA